ncbi:autophagy-related protein 27-domain-containing protein [Mycena sp. CBHHK59/15]|nr:autophagy-related protein 27-domain-containing protein [Mycena sp. CBHHK59/15]
MLSARRWWWWPLIAGVAADHVCNFALNSLEFDLCPVFAGPSTSVSFAEDTPPTHTAQVYAIGLGAPLDRDVTLPAELQCPEGTWICLTVVNTRPSHPSEPSRILQVVPVANELGLNPKAKLLAKVDADDTHDPLQITLHGGSYNHQSQKASFQFHCDHEAAEPTLPAFKWQWNGTHTFSWRTKHACPRALPPGAPGRRPDDEPDADPPATPPPDPDADDRESAVSRPAAFSTLFIVFWLSASIFALRFFYPSLLRLGRRISMRGSMATRRSKGFRPSSATLVRWAEEESALEEYDIDPTSSNSDSEGTPLTPNPRATFMIGQYGSAG